MSYELPFGQGRAFLNRGGFANQVFGGWELTWTQTLQAGLPYTVGYSNSPNRYLPTGAQRPDIITTHDEAVAKDWEIGPNRFPTAAQNPYTNFNSFAYPAAFTVGTSDGTRSWAGAELDPAIPGKVLEHRRARSIPTAGGREQLPVQAAAVQQS